MRIRATLSICFAALTLSGSALALIESKVCEDDSDCGEDGVCEKAQWVDGCEPAEDGDTSHCNSEPQIADTGYCYTPPPTCESDEDCGEYLTCQQSNDGVCWADTDGNSGCSEPDPNAPKYCAQATITCEDDSECPREFECLTAPVACLDIYCPDDPDCGCSAPTHKECQPRVIECEDDSACPEDWMCLGGGTFDCGGATDPDSTDSDAAERIAPDCQSSAKGQCYPAEWNSGSTTTGDDLVGESETDNAPGGSAPPRSSDDDANAKANSGGGCSVSRVPSSGGWLLGLLAFPLLALRRRRSASA
jgi:MYXO-CTERM domain-containing protein